MLARRRLRVAGSLQNVVQSADEMKGVAEAFDDLSEELTNNRIDNPDLKSRLGEQIAQPLHLIAEQRMPQLAAQLKLVEERHRGPGRHGSRIEKGNRPSRRDSGRHAASARPNVGAGNVQ